MTGSTAPVVALVIASFGILLIPDRAPTVAGRRSRAAVVRRGGVSPRVRKGVVAGLGVSAAAVLLVPAFWWGGVVLAVPVGVLAGRRDPKRSEREVLADNAELAVRCDLLAACLDAGMSVGAALGAVSAVTGAGHAVQSPKGRAEGASVPGSSGSTTGGSVAQVWDAVAALLALGAAPEVAWRAADDHPGLAPLAAAARRSATGGVGFSEAVREHAKRLRQQRSAAHARAAGRAGVVMTAPLGLCFLPAFLCLGLAPVVVGLISEIGIF